MTAPFTLESEFPYELQERVGEGAMGEVYQAWESALARTVAIKMLRRPLVSSQGEQAARRLLQEARSAAALTHPGVAAVYRIGQVDACPYIAMEWIEGRTLGELLDTHGPLSIERAGRVALDLLEVLEAVHRAGIVHRDIKPDNIFLTRDGRLKVTDFGVARLRGMRRVAMPPTRGAIGTPLYASPEQLRAAHDEVDGRSDLYGVGAVLYEALAGRPVIASTQLLEVFNAALRQPPEPLRDLVPEVSPALEAVVMRALAKSPDERYPDATAMRRALWRALNPDETASSASPAASARVTTPATQLDPGRGAARRRVALATDDAVRLLDALAHSWPARTLGRQPPHAVLERLLSCPLHAAAFAGAMRVERSVLWLWEGMVLTAFDAARPTLDADAVLDALPTDAEVALCPLPAELEPHRRVLKHLAALHGADEGTPHRVDSAALEVMLRRLMVERFDGHLRIADDSGRDAILIFDRGQRVLDLWPPERDDALAPPGKSVALSLSAVHFDHLPQLTWRHKLSDLDFTVGPAERRPRPTVLRAERDPAASLDPARMALRRHHDMAPLAALQHWLLDTLVDTCGFEALTRTLARVARIRWYHAPAPALPDVRYALVTLDADDRVLHLVEQVHRLDAATLTAARKRLERVMEALGARDAVALPILVARLVDDDLPPPGPLLIVEHRGDHDFRPRATDR